MKKLKIKLNLAFTVFLIFVNSAFAQLKIGQWQEHLSYFNVSQITQTDARIYANSGASLFSYDKSTNQLEKLSTINGLSGIGISAIQYHAGLNKLIIAYADGNIDVLDIKSNTVKKLPELRDRMLQADKTIYSIFTEGKFAYLCSGIGILKLNLDKMEFADTFIIGKDGSYLQINAFTADNLFFYAATKDGLYVADKLNPLLVDFQNWSVIKDLPSTSVSYADIVSSRIGVFACTTINGVAYVYLKKSDTWEQFVKLNSEIKHLEFHDNKLYVTSFSGITCYSSNGVLLSEIPYWDYPSFSAQMTLHDKNGVLWIADGNNGLVSKSGTGTFQYFKPNSPRYSGVSDIDIVKDKLFAAGGSHQNPWNNYGGYVLQKGMWTNIHQSIDPKLAELYNISVCRINPTDTSISYGGSWGFGLAAFKGNKLVKIYDETNSVLQPVDGYGHGYVRIAGLDYDSKGNLWIAISESKYPFYKLTPDGTMSLVPVNTEIFGQNKGLGKILVTKDNIKWAIVLKNGLYVFDDSGHEKSVSLYDLTGRFITSFIYSLVEDLEGNLYAGTDKGVAIISNPGRVFTNNGFYAYQPIYEHQYLLYNELVTCIAVDGANRKWVGTDNGGLYLISADGSKPLLNFNKNNSPLISNRILSVAVNQLSGEVFVATDKGMMSFRSEATGGADDFQDVYVFPNPVKPGYDGDIVVAGLMADSNIKITDLAGNLVYESKSTGGQMVWNGLKLTGEQVSSGIYLVFCTSNDGTQTHVAKFAIVK